uniref:Leucine rich repeat containing protein n=1 Tax=Coptotermes formosanus TaxID=36987 RepID=R4UKP2_COPFO|nr:leucine rich repeat containing protein [Coptotermes formosanus]
MSQSTIEALPDFCFYSRSGLRIVLLPKSLRRIGARCFQNCGRLETADLSRCPNLTTIGAGAFGHCSLSDVSLPVKDLTEMGDSCFLGCGVANLDLVNCRKLTALGSWTFSNCVSLVSIRLPPSLRRVGAGCFAYCTKLKSAAFGEVVEWGEDPFVGCRFEELTFLGGHGSLLGGRVFPGCARLWSMTVSLCGRRTWPLGGPL